MITAEIVAEQLAYMPMLSPFDSQVSACSACTAEMMQFASGLPGDRHHLKAVPIFGDTGKTVDITVCQRPDGSDWLLGKGSSGKVHLLDQHAMVHYLGLHAVTAHLRTLLRECSCCSRACGLLRVGQGVI